MERWQLALSLAFAFGFVGNIITPMGSLAGFFGNLFGLFVIIYAILWLVDKVRKR
jgi:hypothetical protein